MCNIHEKRFVESVFLTQSDTTVGFLSQNYQKLQEIKSKRSDKLFLVCVDSLQTLQNFTRVPKKHKKLVRRSNKTTFIYKDQAIRVVKDKLHLRVLNKLKWAYSTSANPSNMTYDKSFAFTHADIVVEDSRGLYESSSSSLIKLRKNNKRRLR